MSPRRSPLVGCRVLADERTWRSKMEASNPEPEIDRRLTRLSDSARSFARLPTRQKADLLAQVASRLVEVAPGMVEAACRAKGIDPESDLAGEEWFASPVITQRCVRLL